MKCAHFPCEELPARLREVLTEDEADEVREVCAECPGFEADRDEQADREREIIAEEAGW